MRSLIVPIPPVVDINQITECRMIVIDTNSMVHQSPGFDSFHVEIVTGSVVVFNKSNEVVGALIM